MNDPQRKTVGTQSFCSFWPHYKSTGSWGINWLKWINKTQGDIVSGHPTACICLKNKKENPQSSVVLTLQYHSQHSICRWHGGSSLSVFTLSHAPYHPLSIKHQHRHPPPASWDYKKHHLYFPKAFFFFLLITKIVKKLLVWRPQRRSIAQRRKGCLLSIRKMENIVSLILWIQSCRSCLL